MTIKELIRELKTFPQEAEVRIIKDFEDCDEYGNTNSVELTCVCKQYIIDDPQFDNSLQCDCEILLGG